MNSHCGVSYNRSSCHTIFRSRRTVSAVGERIAHSTKFIAILVEKAVEPLAPIRQARFKGGDGMSAAAKKGPRTDETAQSVKPCYTINSGAPVKRPITSAASSTCDFALSTFPSRGQHSMFHFQWDVPRARHYLMLPPATDASPSYFICICVPARGKEIPASRLARFPNPEARGIWECGVHRTHPQSCGLCCGLGVAAIGRRKGRGLQLFPSQILGHLDVELHPKF
ncbi:hypothetical protein B0H14DRAFT_3154118 [Mycena olivaceomarginata]|nr:hypothetical protein B0H14DRAFT_3154118 [Mycena olivaceomarginata]